MCFVSFPNRFHRFLFGCGGTELLKKEKRRTRREKRRKKEEKGRKRKGGKREERFREQEYTYSR
jgi:hypothetical protein